MSPSFSSFSCSRCLFVALFALSFCLSLSLTSLTHSLRTLPAYTPALSTNTTRPHTHTLSAWCRGCIWLHPLHHTLQLVACDARHVATCACMSSTASSASPQPPPRSTTDDAIRVTHLTPTSPTPTDHTMTCTATMVNVTVATLHRPDTSLRCIFPPTPLSLRVELCLSPLPLLLLCWCDTQHSSESASSRRRWRQTRTPRSSQAATDAQDSTATGSSFGEEREAGHGTRCEEEGGGGASQARRDQG